MRSDPRASDPHLGASPHLRVAARRRRRRGSPGSSGSTRTARISRRAWRGIRATSPSASGGAWRSRSSSRATPPCCSSTSRRADSTQMRGPWCGGRSAGCAESGTAVLVASHEPESAALADRVHVDGGGRALRREQRRVRVPQLRLNSDVTSRVPGSQAPSAATRAELWTAPPPAVPPPGRRSRGPARRGRSPTPPGGVADRPATSGPASWSASSSARPRAIRCAHAVAARAVAAANLVALAAFCWPLVATAVPAQAHAAVPDRRPGARAARRARRDRDARRHGAVSAHMLALLGTLAAIGAAVRIAGTGVGGVEAVFILLILAGRAYGARFGMLLGMATIALSTLVTGTFGPWTPFQMFACAWVGAAGGAAPQQAAPRRRDRDALRLRRRRVVRLRPAHEPVVLALRRRVRHRHLVRRRRADSTSTSRASCCTRSSPRRSAGTRSARSRRSSASSWWAGRSSPPCAARSRWRRTGARLRSPRASACPIVKVTCQEEPT